MRIRKGKRGAQLIGGLSVALVLLPFVGSHGVAQTSPHGSLSFSCEECHTADSWTEMVSPPRFQHEKTGFPLQGQHATVQCMTCHTTLKFAVAGQQCVDCHEDQHRGELGTACDRCHSPDSWLVPDMVQRHAQTGFALVGAHAFADCRQCHTNEQKHQYVGVRTDCFGCHRSDYDGSTAPNHRQAGFSVDCTGCHKMNDMTWGGSFDHARTAFPLLGAHLATPCIQCHAGNRFRGTPTTCVNCHQQQFVSARQPSHAGFSTDCLSCHSMNGWQPATFDHTKTVFPLTGSHISVPCAQCHANGVFAGTPTACISCHQSIFQTATNPVHTGFPTDCTTCHTTIAWQPSTFDHSKSAFPLTGAHQAVACTQCHAGGVFTTAPTTCIGCHQSIFQTAANPVHTGFPTDCTTCHNTIAWQPSTFDHSKSAFPLTGAHVTVACTQCHTGGVFSTAPTTCIGCHQSIFQTATNPVHTGFPTDCTTCHTTTVWQPSTFDHSKTVFPLTGAHQALTCTLCHTGGVFSTAPTTCIGCHQSNFQTAANPVHTGFPTDCTTCHTTTAWQPSTFDHSKTVFPLTGAHQALTCTQCHTGGVFSTAPTTCIGCHQPDFQSAANPSHTGFPTDCTTCHTTAAWQPALFDHSKSAFPLTGAHLAVACTQCHIGGVFSTAPTTCIGCHQTDFQTTTDPPHTGFSTDCTTCHTTSAWMPALFDHSKTIFPLTGAHVSVACATCHVNKVYAGLPTSCGNAGCHLKDYNATTNPAHASAGFPLDCTTCHTTTAWSPSTFAHDPYFPISAGSHHAPGRWTLCADCHPSATDFSQFACITCHAHQPQSSVDGEHSGVSGYSYNSAACYRCHPKGSGG